MSVPNSVIFTFPNTGRKLELFYVSKLAEAVSRDPHTIRGWERKGVLPDCMFRDKAGRRLYSKEQIDTIVTLLKEENVRQGQDIAKTNFIKKVHEQLAELKEEYLTDTREVS